MLSSRIGYLSLMQKKKLTELVMEDPQLISGKFGPTFTLKEAKNRWESIANTLNAIPGGCKDWKQWRKCWQDLKAKTKNKQAKMIRHARGTGGGPSFQQILTEDEARILETISPASIQGHTGVSESLASFDMGIDVIPTQNSPHDDSSMNPQEDDVSGTNPQNIVGTINYESDIETVEQEDVETVIGQKSTPQYLKKRLGSTMAAKKMMKHSEEVIKLKREKLQLQKETNSYLKRIAEWLEKSNE